MSLFDSIQPVVAKWTTRYRRSPVPAFLAWWKAELVGSLPARWQAWFQDRREVWLASIEGDELVLRREGQSEPLARFDLGRPANEVRTELARLAGREVDHDRLTILAVPQAQVLLRSLQFPPAVEQNLRQVLSFEMDRQTPFKADQVYFDYRADLAANGRQVKVDLALMPRPALDGLLQRLKGLDLALDGVDVATAGSARAGFNLLPETLRVRRSNPQRRMNWILIGIAALLLMLTMQQLLANRTQALEALRANVDAARGEAHAVVALRGQLNTAVEGAGYLADKKRNEPSVMRVLGDLSSRLPDDTWLERLTFRNQNLEIVGQSGEATRLIALLQGSSVLAGPAFSGQISPDAQTRKERFNLNASYDLRPEQKAVDPEPAAATERAPEDSTQTPEAADSPVVESEATDDKAAEGDR